MKNSIFKALLCIISLGMVTNAISMQYPYRQRGQYPGRGPAMPGQAAQGIQMGDLIIRNTLNEPVQWHVSTRPSGFIAQAGGIQNLNLGSGMPASKSGYLPANNAGQLDAGAIAPDIWGSTINLTLKRASGGAGLQTQLQQLGTYVLRIDDRGNLVLERQN